MRNAPWYVLAQTHVGKREVRGSKHNPEIVAWFEASGHGWIKDDETAWCAAFANAMLEQAGYSGTGSVAARSFLKWGVPVERPTPGCIAVFKRGNSEWQGHVAFFVSETDTHVRVLGGNQGNAVSVANYPKRDLLGYRWPKNIAKSKTANAALGVGGFGGYEAGEQGYSVIERVIQAKHTAEDIGLLDIASDSLTQLVSNPRFLIGVALVAVGLFIWWDRRRKLNEEGV